MTPSGAGIGDVVVHRVGPNGSLPADHQFGVALTSLWHAVSEAGGTVGFLPGQPRSSVAPKAAAVVSELRAGTSVGIVLVVNERTLVGFGKLTPGDGLISHTGSITVVMVDPECQGNGLGHRLMTEILAVATGLGLESVQLSIRDGHNLDRFYGRHGFTEWGRRAGWVRVSNPGEPVEDRDEIFLAAQLNPTPEVTPQR